MSASIDVLPIESISLDAANARIHPDENRRAIRASLSRFGAGRSIVLDGANVVRAGNGTLEAARSEGIREVIVIEPRADQLVAVRRPDWSPDEASAYALADNRTQDSSIWDAARVAETLASIQDDTAKRATAFSDAAVAALLASVDGTTQVADGSHHEPSSGLPAIPANAPPSLSPPVGGQSERSEREASETAKPNVQAADLHAQLMAKWQTAIGQAWEIPSLTNPGYSHRLVIGDCADLAIVRKACPRGVQGIVTSPPYADQRKSQYRGIPADRYAEWWDAIQANRRAILAQNGSMFVNIKPHSEDGQRHPYVMKLVATMVEQWGWRFVDEFTWVRSGPPGSWPNRFKNGFEPVYHFSINPDIKFRPLNVATIGNGSLIGVTGERDSRSTGSGFGCKPESAKREGPVLPSNVLNVNVGATVPGHSATYPIGVPSFFVKAFSDPTDTWFDPFVGSGTTILACEEASRLCSGTEEKPEHAAVLLERLASSGLSPILLS